ncbi:MAG: SRPBCC domain-containing protein [Acidobacteriota bacterium]
MTQAVDNTLEITLSKDIRAPRKKVFEAWLDTEALTEFIRPAEGVTIPKAEVDAREGGSFLILMQVGEQQLPHSGEYKIIDRYETLAFTWNSAHAGEGSLVTLTFEELSAGTTRVVLHHVGLPSEDSRNAHQGGWTKILDALAQFSSS